MSKFNKTAKETQKVNRTPNSTNMAGGAAYSRDSIKQDIATTILASMLKGDSFYESEKDRLNRIEDLMLQLIETEPEFLIKSVIYCRTVGNLRSISHFMSVILVENIKGNKFLRNSLRTIMMRVDDSLEIVSLWNARNAGVMIPNSLRRAIKDNLENNWDYYQLKKYFSKKKSVKVSDIIKLTRPNPNIWWENFGKEFEKNYVIK